MGAVGHKKGKVYYSMGEVAEMFDVNPSLIRFWESKFDILKPHKNKKGNRMFTPEDVDNLKLIYHLVKEKGMTLAGAQKRIKNNPEGISRDMEVIERLLRIRAILLELRQELKMDDNEVYREDESEDEILMPQTAPTEEAPEEPFGDDSVVMVGDESLPDYSEYELSELPDIEDATLPFGMNTAEDNSAKPRIIEQTLF